MAVNNLTFEQSAAFLTDLYEQASGQTSAIAVTDTGTFTSVATTLLKMGTEPIMNALSLVLNRTIFDIRPYNAKFNGIMVSESDWGNITRIVEFIDGDVENDAAWTLTDGQSVDQQVIRKPKVIQLNFYGEDVFSKGITIFEDQIKAALQSPAELGSFLSGVMQNVLDQLEQFTESMSRAALINFVTGKYAGDNGNCINVLQAYFDETGVQLTPATMFNSNNYVDFTKWLFAFVNTLTEKMAERSVKYHINITGKEVMQHTPANRMKAYMAAQVLNKIDSTVMSTIFNPDKLKAIDFEKVTFWQNFEDGEELKVSAKPTYLDSDGSLVTSQNAVTINNLLGVIFDETALGVSRYDKKVRTSPYNARGLYYNQWYHVKFRIFNNFMRNGVILYADTVNA